MKTGDISLIDPTAIKMKWTKLPYKAKQLKNGTIYSQRIEMFSAFRTKRILIFDRQYGLLGDNRKVFPVLFGKPSFYYMGIVQNRNWALQLEDGTQILLVASTRGTSYELVTEVGGKPIVCNPICALDFLNQVSYAICKYHERI